MLRSLAPTNRRASLAYLRNIGEVGPPYRLQTNCSVRLMMSEVRDAIALVLDKRSLAAMRVLAEAADGELSYDI